MATVREWLEKSGFTSGSIFYQPVTVDECYGPNPGWASGDELLDIEEIGWSHEILDFVFDDGYGGPEAPRIIAYDGARIYMIYQYDGSTGMFTAPISPKVMRLMMKEAGGWIPYPGC